jgi:6-phosphofructokinase 1
VRLGGIGDVLASRIASETPYESRAVVLGHPQRGGDPSPIDRIMGLLFGARAAELSPPMIWQVGLSTRPGSGM